MVNISVSELERLAQLSNLDLSSDEVQHLSKDLGSILNYVNQLSEVNTNNVEPTYQVQNLKNVWREDELETELDPRLLLNLRPKSQIYRDQIKVPKVL